MLKQNARVLGIDDGPFDRSKDSETCLVGILMRLDGVIESVNIDYIKLDGSAATTAILNFVQAVGRQNIQAIVTEGITFAGFDLVDPEEVSMSSGLPFLSITKGKGNLESMLAALEKHGDASKIGKLKRLTPQKEYFGGNEFTLNISGIEKKEAIILLEKLMKVGNVPEPVRIADMVASAIMHSSKNVP